MKKIMNTAHAIKRAAVVKWDCTEKEIIFGDCISMAHKGEEIKKMVVLKVVEAEKGFDLFNNDSGNFIKTVATMSDVDVEGVIAVYQKKIVAKTWQVNSKGFYMFESRNWNCTGDNNTWARLEDGKVQIHRGSKGYVSEAYAAELNEFLAGYGTFLEDQYFDKTTTIN